jgi:hypothetical protein
MEKKNGQVGKEGVTDAERARLFVAPLGSDTDRVDIDTDHVNPSPLYQDTTRVRCNSRHRLATTRTVWS